MGNFFCVPKQSGNPDSSKRRSLRRWLTDKIRSKGVDKDDISESTSAAKSVSSEVTEDQEETNVAVTNEFATTKVDEDKNGSDVLYICPVVSNSILLRPCDDDDESEKEDDNDHTTTDKVDSVGKRSSGENDVDKDGSEQSVQTIESRFNGSDDLAPAEEHIVQAPSIEAPINEVTMITVVPKLEEKPQSVVGLKVIEVKPVEAKENIDQTSSPETEKCLGIKSISSEDIPPTLDVYPNVIERQPCITQTDGDLIKETSVLKNTNGEPITDVINVNPVTRGHEKSESKMEAKCLPAEKTVLKSPAVAIAPVSNDNRFTKQVVQTSPISTVGQKADIVPVEESSVRSADVSQATQEKAQRPLRPLKVKEVKSCPAVPRRSKVESSRIRELGYLLKALSALKVPESNPVKEETVTASSSQAHVFGPQPGFKDDYESHKHKQGIEKWVKNSTQGTSSPSATTSTSTNALRKVSDFEVPKTAPKPPTKPLSLKKPSPHLYAVPGIARADLADDRHVTWTQTEPRGDKTAVLWTTKPTAFNVKLPPLSKRLLERKGSIENLQDSWILPQVKQIETLKRECGRFPGLMVPKPLRDKYSIEIKTGGAESLDDVKDEVSEETDEAGNLSD